MFPSTLFFFAALHSLQDLSSPTQGLSQPSPGQSLESWAGRELQMPSLDWSRFLHSSVFSRQKGSRRLTAPWWFAQSERHSGDSTAGLPEAPGIPALKLGPSRPPGVPAGGAIMSWLASSQG